MTRLAALSAALLAIVCVTSPRGAAQTRAEQPASDAPRLLVIVVIDQMRFDYLDRYASLWTGGLARLRTRGAVFERAFYPYLNTVTCAGHATIATGSLPYAHGIILNEWYQRTARRRMSCTDDPAVRSVPYSPPAEPIGHSAHRLRAQTLGDRLRAASPASRVVTLSMKPRSTVMLAGHGGTAVTWFGDTNAWGTSTAFTPEPLSPVQAFVSAHPVEGARGLIWDRLRPAGDYRGDDDNPHERPRTGWTRTFPHPLAGAPGTAPGQFFDLWERSPYADAYLGRMAAELVRSYQLGQRQTTDLLGVSFSGLDYVGHDFGPDSQEVQDTLARLDRTLDELFTVLDAAVGPTRYVVGLSADHGVARIPEALTAEGTEAGRVLNAEVAKTAEAAMTAAHGPGPHVALAEYTNLYLSEAARARAAEDPAYVRPLLMAVAKMPGVLRAFVSKGLETRRDSPDPIERAAALSYHPEESGEITIVLKRHWIGTSSSAATHGSAQDYDQHVPVIFLGPTFAPGRYTVPASPADLAPTLAAVGGIAMPGVDGRSLADVMRR